MSPPPISGHGYAFTRGGYGNITATDKLFRVPFFPCFRFAHPQNKTYSSFIPESSPQHNTYIHQTFIYIYHNLFHRQFTYSHSTFIILKLIHQFTCYQLQGQRMWSVYRFRWLTEPSFGIDNLFEQKCTNLRTDKSKFPFLQLCGLHGFCRLLNI